MMRGFEFETYPNHPQDSYLSTVNVYQDQYTQGAPLILEKTSRSLLDENDKPMLDFMRRLMKVPHPNLLTPISVTENVTGEGRRLVEYYRFIKDPLLSNVSSQIRKGLAEQTVEAQDIVDLMLQLTDALSYIHGLGLVHRDVRKQNMFVSIQDNHLQLTLFDYNSLCEPFHQSEGVDSWHIESPPELKWGDVWVDSRFDVYAVGSILNDLLYDYTRGDRRLLINPAHPVLPILQKSKTRLKDCYPDAIAMHKDLQLIK